MKLGIRGHLMLCIGLIVFGCLYQAWVDRFVSPMDLIFPFISIFPQVVLGMALGLTKAEPITPNLLLERRPFVWSGLILCLVVMIGSLALHVYSPTTWLSQYPTFIWGDVGRNTESLYLEHAILWPAMGSMVNGVLIAPVCEELFYRRRIYRLLAQNMGHTRAMILAALLFAALHLNLGYSWAGFLQVAAWGMALTEIYKRSGSITLTMVVHSTVNFVIYCAVIGHYRLITS